MGLAFGCLLATIRTRRGEKQQDWAAKSGVSQPVLSRIEMGAKVPDLVLLEHLSSVLGMPGARVLQVLEDQIARAQRIAEANLPTVTSWEECAMRVGDAGLRGLLSFCAACVDREQSNQTREVSEYGSDQ